MIQELEQIEYRCGTLRQGVRPKSLPVRIWRGAKIKPEMRKAIYIENVLNLGGVYGKKLDDNPVEYDNLKLVLTYDTVEITVYNREKFLRANDEQVGRIHRMLSTLTK
jgi:hypothetical protein